MDSTVSKLNILGKEIESQILASIEAKTYLLQETSKLIAIANVITIAFTYGNKLLLFGNGGSAADAQHIAGELSGKLYMERDPLPALALTTNTSAITAIGNDYSYEDIFARQVRGFAKKGDVVIGISTSGNSPNILKGLSEAKRKGAVTIVFTGKGGKVNDLADYILSIPSNDTLRIQEAHILAGHIICYLIDRALLSPYLSINTGSTTMAAGF